MGFKVGELCSVFSDDMIWWVSWWYGRWVKVGGGLCGR